MSDNTAIEWANASWPVTTGCERVSDGCTHCYAIQHSRRLAGNPNPKVSGPYEGTTEYRDGRLDFTSLVKLHPDRLDWPLRWRKPRRIFVCSMSDLFHEDVLDEFIARVFAVMALADRHIFQVLTKRPRRMARLLSEESFREQVEGALEAMLPAVPRQMYVRIQRRRGAWLPLFPWPLTNVWCGTSVEDQKRADLRIPHLLGTPAAVRFLSCEPLLGPLKLSVGVVEDAVGRPDRSGRAPGTGRDGRSADGESAEVGRSTGRLGSPDEPTATLAGIHWCIVGGESGPGARPMDVQWARSLVEQCRAAGVSPFVKQLGAHPGFRLEDEERRGNPAPSFHHYDEGSGLYIKAMDDKKGGDPDEWPEDLRVREMPAGVRVPA